MKLPQFKKYKWIWPALAFCVPILAFLIIMIVTERVPFGQFSSLYSDMYHQYYPFFLAFRRALLSGESLLYSWDVGMGMDYLGLISYYLASPLNLLSVLMPEEWMLGYFSLLTPIKLGFASMFFCIFLQKLFKKNDLSVTLFGCFYGLCAWALGYQWNIMWLDTFALLPLVALGTVFLLRDKKFLLYTVSLFLAVAANYYIGFFVCIFVLLVFICYQICRCRSIRRFFEDLVRIALFSALAIGMTTFLTLPALKALQSTYSSVNTFPEEFRLNIVSEHTWEGLLDALKQVAGNMNGGLVPTFKEGLPNLYCGVGTTIFACLFLTCRQVKFRDKICSVTLLLFFAVSFVIRQLDYIWHGFHFPNMIPYRFSFLFSFVLLYMAYRAYLLRQTFRPWQLAVAAVPALGIMLCAKDLQDPVHWAYNGVFLLLYLGALLLLVLHKRFSHRMPRAKKVAFFQSLRFQRGFAGGILLGIFAMELVLNCINFGINFPKTQVINYPQGTTYAASMIRYMHEREEDNLFFRAETTHSQTLNDGALNGYNGITTFTSSANVTTTEFMQALGFAARNNYNRYCFEEASPVANLFLNLKYMIERTGQVEENRYFTDLHSYGTVHLLENNAYLPLGFLAEPELAELDFVASGFSFQNRLLQAATGIDEDVWQMLTGNNLIISSTDAAIISQPNAGQCTYKSTGSLSTTVVYSYTADAEGFLCIYLNFPKRNSYHVYKNGQYLFTESVSLPQMMAISDVAPGDVIDIRVVCPANQSGSLTINAAILKDDVFQEAYRKLSASTLNLISFENTRIEGTIRCDRDGYLYTSIPQDGNWQVWVDGEPAEIQLTGEAMVGVMLTEGYHTVTFRYRNSAFTLGVGISLVCLVAFGTLYYVCYKPKWQRKKGKYEK